MRTLALSLLLALAAPAAAEPVVAAAAGGGWDSNLSRGDGATPVVAGGFLSARALAGWAFAIGERAELSAEASWDGIRYPTLGGLDEHRPGVTLAWMHELHADLRARLAAGGGLRLAQEDARSGAELTGALTLAWRALPRLTLRAGGGYVRRTANDPVYAGDRWQARVGADLDLWRDAFVSVGYVADLGEDTFYAPVEAASATAFLAAGNGAGGSGSGSGSGSGAGGQGYGGGDGAGPGGRYGLPVGTFGGTLVAYEASRVAHLASIDLTLALPAGIYMGAGYAFSTARGDVQSWRAHSVTGELGWRW